MLLHTSIFPNGTVFICLLAVMAILIIIAAVRRTARRKKAANQLVNTLERLKSTPSDAAIIASELKTVIGKVPLTTSETVAAMLVELSHQPRLGDYTIYGIFPAGENSWLFVTVCAEPGYEPRYGNDPHEVTNIYQRNFVLRKNIDRKREEICSHAYETFDEERMLKRFSRHLLELLEWHADTGSIGRFRINTTK
jgi:hypothetical protein